MMEIKQKKENDVTTVSISGRIDSETAPILLNALEETMNQTNHLVLDFKNVEYASSAGLRVILIAQKTMSEKGILEVANVNEEIKDVFDLTGFSDILTII